MFFTACLSFVIVSLSSILRLARKIFSSLETGSTEDYFMTCVLSCKMIVNLSRLPADCHVCLSNLGKYHLPPPHSSLKLLFAAPRAICHPIPDGQYIILTEFTIKLNLMEVPCSWNPLWCRLWLTHKGISPRGKHFSMSHPVDEGELVVELCSRHRKVTLCVL